MALLFLIGGVFGYLVAIRYGLEFLLGIGRSIDARPVVSISEYFDLFLNVILGVSTVFELPLVIFLVTRLGIVTPEFLWTHSRYSILGITILAAVITPTLDMVGCLTFAVPMYLLFFVGLFACYLVEQRKRTLLWTGGVLAIAGGGYLAWRFRTRSARTTGSGGRR